MKTILVPVDFSATALNAARYAVRMSRQVGAERLILFHTYGGSYQILDQGPEVVYETTRILLENMTADLKKLQEELDAIAPASLHIDTHISDGFLLEDALELVKEHGVDLIVMGITGKNNIEQKLIGTNTYRLSSESPVPVLIVPSKADFSEVKHVALSLKFKEGIFEETPYMAIKDIIKDLGAKLTILNVAKEDYLENPRAVQQGVKESKRMFGDVEASVVYLGDDDVVPSIVEYVNDNDIQLLLAITHKMGFLKSLFQGSVTKQLAFHTTVPLMVFRAIEDKP